MSWESGLEVSGDSEVAVADDDVDTPDLFRAASEPVDEDTESMDDLHRALTANDDGASDSPTTRSDGTRGEDANPTGTLAGADDVTTTPGRGDGSGADRWGAASGITPDMREPVTTGVARSGPGTKVTPGVRSELYGEPVSFEGRSLEGTLRSGDPKELARSLDGAELPVEDLSRVEPGPAKPARRSIVENAEGRPDSRRLHGHA